MTLQNNHIILPNRLDNYIFNELNAKYCKSNSDMTVIDWDKTNMLNYLGTYFPRSYAEILYIFSRYFDNNNTEFVNRKTLNIFDFGSGTGGELIGLLTVILQRFKQIKTVNISAFDGNHHTLRLFEKVLRFFKKTIHTDVKINCNIIPVRIDDFYDLRVLDSVLTEKYDLIITCKTICEFVNKNQLENKNPYLHFIKTFRPKLNTNGLMLISDVTTKSSVSNEWLVDMMNSGVDSLDCYVVDRNQGYNQTISVSHTRQKGDISKIAWRIIKN